MKIKTEYYLFLCIFLGLFACKKVNDVPLSTDIKNNNNGGGTKDPVIASCDSTVTENHISLTSFPDIDFYSVSGGGSIIHANGYNGDCTIYFPNDLKSAGDKKYYLMGCYGSSIAEGTARIEITTGGTFSYLYCGRSEYIYVNIIDDKIQVTFCDVKFSSNSTSWTFNATGRIVVE